MERINTNGTGMEEVAEGVYLGDLATGERAGMKYWRVEPGATLPAHRHHNEQIGYMISGELVAIVEGEEVLLEPGDAYRFESDEHHGAENRGDEPAVGVGVLAPPRGRPGWGERGEAEPGAPR
ncbi:cupin domain-containing protein [Halalkalicoccus tibetensis]|uniref:Cupin domain-containing protein n=1 Tax=Halalkalicoccus tibetensis TaxID=175632 RepID=A0ABD5V0W5_9EURY